MDRTSPGIVCAFDEADIMRPRPTAATELARSPESVNLVVKMLPSEVIYVSIEVKNFVKHCMKVCGVDEFCPLHLMDWITYADVCGPKVDAIQTGLSYCINTKQRMSLFAAIMSVMVEAGIADMMSARTMLFESLSRREFPSWLALVERNSKPGDVGFAVAPKHIMTSRKAYFEIAIGVCEDSIVDLTGLGVSWVMNLDDDVEQVQKALRRCNVCGHPNARLLCSECSSIYYCSKDCQKSDWRTHRLTCNGRKSRVYQSIARWHACDVGLWRIVARSSNNFPLL